MKTTFRLFCLMFLLSFNAWSQCVPTCSSYVASPITFTTFPSGSTNVTPTFTNSFIGLFADDGSIGPIPIGFNFDYYCNTYTNIHICSNGFIMLDYQPFPWPTQYVHPTQNLPDPGLPNGMVAFNMTDLDPGQGGTITYTTVGVAPNRMFIVTYSNVPCFTTPSDLNTGQIVFFETTNIIEIHTTKARPDANQLSLGGTQGIENTSGTIGVTPPGRNANNSWGATADSTAYRFAPYTPAPPTSVTGNTLLCQGAQGSYQTSPLLGALSYTWALPAGWTGTSSTTALTTTAGVSGNVSVSATYTCGTSAPAMINVSVVSAPVVSILSATPSVLCSGNSITINPNGAVSYSVEPGGITGTPPLQIQVNASTIFSVTGQNASGCVSINTATVAIVANTTPTVTVNSGSTCVGQTFTITPSGANGYIISGGFFIVSPTVGLNTYTVTGTATNGCVSDPAICQVTAIALPTLNVVSTKSIICVKESATLTASGATTYSWSNSALTAATVVSPTITTTYTVTGDNNGCKSSKAYTQMVSLCLGIESTLDEESGVRLFPNPASTELSIQLLAANPNAELKLYNLSHQLVKQVRLQEVLNVLDIRDVTAGLYLVEIHTGNEIQIKKITIEH
ncbi:MAG: T9SS type A sorting domain-containing protein [Bacteroidia bacterium]|nr:T9SS type A sorting domain-containing protein [Bacteroidia bacterium]